MKKTITEREADFRVLVNGFAEKFPQEMLKEFGDYWTEPNKSATKMRFELEKTWDLSRRINKWANNGFGTQKMGVIARTPKLQPKPKNEIEELDEALNDYKKHPSEYSVDRLEKWYALMEREKLFKVFTRGEVNEIKGEYQDNAKCRGACVMRTFDFFALHNFTFTELLKARANE